MAKKPTSQAVVPQMPERSDMSTSPEFGDRERALAERLNIDVSAPLEDLAQLAVSKMGMALRLIVEAGVNFMALKDRLPHGEFIPHLSELGVDRRRAHEAMVLARAVAALPEQHAEQVMALPKTKAMALVNADSVVLEAMLEDGEADLNLIGVRELRAKLRELEASLADATVQRDTAEAEAEGLKKKLSKAPKAREDGVPMVVADLRAEIMAEGKKAALAVDALGAVGNDIMALIGTEEAHDWADATLRLAFSQLAALRVQMDGLLTKYARELPGQDPTPAKLSYLSQQEIVEAAQAHEQLTKVSQYEAELRKWEREQERPRGKGRPSAKPVAPGGAA